MLEMPLYAPIESVLEHIHWLSHNNCPGSSLFQCATTC